MAFAAVASTADPRSQSIGPRKMQVMTWSAASADTTGTVTAANMQYVEAIVIDGLKLTAAPTFSGNVATLAFTDPAATVYGTLLIFGR